MVSKELQDKFYAAMESLKDGKNNYIVDALTAGAKATFESIAGLGSPLVNKEQLDNLKKINAGEENESKGEPVTEGAESSDPGFIGKLHAHVPDEPVQSNEDYEPPSYPSKLTYDDMMKMTHDPSTEESEEPVDVLDHLTGNSGNRFPTYDGQFAGSEDYSMVAEAVTKLGNTIDAMKTTDNASLLEAIKEGYKVCFESIVDKDADEIALDKFVDAFSNSITDLSLRRDGMTECTVMFAGEPVGKVSVVMDRDIGDAGRYTPKFTIVSTATGEQFVDLPESGPFGAGEDTYRKLADNVAAFIVLHDKEKLAS